MKYIILVTVWLISIQTVGHEPILIGKLRKTQSTDNTTVYKKEALLILYTNDWKSSDRDTLKYYLDPIFIPICSKYNDYYNINIDTLVACIQTLATSESGNSKGQPFSSTLFIDYNNPFGIKGKGCNIKTIEYYNNIRTVITDDFRYFNSLYEAIDYLVGHLLLTDRYIDVRNANTVEQFFYNLKKCGYFTDPNWHEEYLIPTCNKYYL